MQLYPHLINAYCSLDTQYMIKDTQKRLQNYTKAIKSNPDNAELYYQRAEVSFQVKDYQSAIKDYNSSIRLDQNHGELYFAYKMRGLLYYYSHKYQQAIADFEKALEFSPDSYDVALYLEEARSSKTSIDEIYEW